MNEIATNLTRINQRIAAAADSAGRQPNAVSLVAVSKVQPAESIEAAYRAGQRDFGENYAQELRDKAEALAGLDGLRWHFIGHLQRNKAKYVVPVVSVLETVDSARLVDELDRQTARFNRSIECLVQVNVGGEEQKSGCAPEEVTTVLNAVERAKGLTLDGLMTIPPFELEADETRVYFQALAKLRDQLGGPAKLRHLSMGMSHDFEVAIDEGATLVRVGTAVFGPRPPRR